MGGDPYEVLGEASRGSPGALGRFGAYRVYRGLVAGDASLDRVAGVLLNLLRRLEAPGHGRGLLVHGLRAEARALVGALGVEPVFDPYYRHVVMRRERVEELFGVIAEWMRGTGGGVGDEGLLDRVSSALAGEVARAGKTRPYLEEASAILDGLLEGLLGGGVDPVDAWWAASVASRVLVFLPLAGGDKERAVYLLTEGYEPSGYEVPLYLLDVAVLYRVLKSIGDRGERLRFLARARACAGMDSEASTSLYRAVRGIVEDGLVEPVRVRAAVESAARSAGYCRI